MKYEIVTSIDGTSYACVKRDDGDGQVSFIPMDEVNPDYQEYLAWRAEQ